MTDCEDDEDISRGQSPMIPLTIEKSVAIKAEPNDIEFLESVKNEEYEDDEDNVEEDKGVEAGVADPPPLPSLLGLELDAGQEPNRTIQSIARDCLFGDF